MLKQIRQQADEKRKGGVLVLGAFFLVAILTFVGMSVDLGLVNVTKTRMQTCADTCALAAAQEIVLAVREAGQEGSSVSDLHAHAKQEAIAMARDMANKNGFWLKNSDVEFGRREWDADNNEFVVDWQGSPYNAVRVTVRRDGNNPRRRDSKLQLLFAPVFGSKTVSLNAKASAYVEARDFVTVLDYSGSMNFDSLPFKSSLSQSSIRNNLDDIYDSLVNSGAYYSNRSDVLKFPVGGWGKIDSYEGTYIHNNSDWTVYNSLELDKQVSFYDYNNYGRFLFQAPAGTYNLNLSWGGNYKNKINSFKVPSGMKVTLWGDDVESNRRRGGGGGGGGGRGRGRGGDRLIAPVDPALASPMLLAGPAPAPTLMPAPAPVPTPIPAPQYGWKFGPKTSNVSSMGSKNNDAERIKVEVTGLNYNPFPQEGRNGVGGSFKGMPSYWTSKNLWRDYIKWVIAESKSTSGDLYINSANDYRYRYGYRTLMMYLLHQRAYNDESEDLWRVPAYPYKAVKDGMTQFTDFLGDLSFGDRLALVDYATTSRKQNSINTIDVSSPNNISNVDFGSAYLTSDYDGVDTIQSHHQASHYSGSTNIGDGVKKAREILVDEGRIGARWQMLVMTDGVVNQPSTLPSMPSGWKNFAWDDLTDWDGDGNANYDQTDINTPVRPGYSAYADQKLYLFYQAKKAVEAGAVVHTMAVGNGADTNLMKAIATMGGGIYIHIPATATAEQMAQTLEAKFNLLAGNVPPAKLLYEENGL